MDGFKRPHRPDRQLDTQTTNLPPVEKQPSGVPIPEQIILPDVAASTSRKLPPFLSTRLRLISFATFALLLAFAGAIYGFLLTPRDPSATETVSVEIVSGMIPSQIANKLEEAGVIRSSSAFNIYTRLRGVQGSLLAGNYELSPAKSTPAIAAELQGGNGVDEIEVMFKPGATLADNKKVLLKLGYDESEIDTAFGASYDHPLFTDRPAGRDLEGYIFGETHRFSVGTPIKDILDRYFDDYYTVIEENNLVSSYKNQNLSLYEGITLASIVQRESGGDDKPGIAQVFLLRLSEGMPLGSDVTYQYIADKEGNPRDINYDSPYNTRRYAGLPPGPIASPGTAALKAVASPADSNYLYFLSGDDNVTYFARTFSEHEANIRNHCQEKCKII